MKYKINYKIKNNLKLNYNYIIKSGFLYYEAAENESRGDLCAAAFNHIIQRTPSNAASRGALSQYDYNYRIINKG